MTTHSKGSYVAYRSKRNAPTRLEKLHRERIRIAEELQRFCNEPFPNGAEVVYSLDDYNRDTRELAA